MEITQLREDVFVVDSLISESECKAIIGYLDGIVNANLLQWNQISFFGSFAMGYWPSDPNLLHFGLPEDYFAQLKEKIKIAGEKCFETYLKSIFLAFHKEHRYLMHSTAPIVIFEKRDPEKHPYLQSLLQKIWDL